MTLLTDEINHSGVIKKTPKKMACAAKWSRVIKITYWQTDLMCHPQVAHGCGPHGWSSQSPSVKNDERRDKTNYVGWDMGGRMQIWTRLTGATVDGKYVGWQERCTQLTESSEQIFRHNGDRQETIHARCLTYQEDRKLASMWPHVQLWVDLLTVRRA